MAKEGESSRLAGGSTGKQRKSHTFAPAVSDPRFARLQTDPRFLRPSRDDGKVVLDERFKSLLNNGEGGHGGEGRRRRGTKTDKFGRPIKEDRRSRDELQRLYRTEQAEEEDSDKGSEREEESEEDEAPHRTIDYARGEGVLESSGEEESDEEESDEDDQTGPVVIGPASTRRKAKYEEHAIDSDEFDEEEARTLDADENQLAELDARAERSVKSEAKQQQQQRQTKTFAGDTNRLAAVNMDWDHIRAIDLFKVFSSVVSPAGASRPASAAHAERRRRQGDAAKGIDRPILPAHGRCVSVRIYPSEFGRKRMEKEMVEGPPRDIFTGQSDGQAIEYDDNEGKDDEEDDEEESETSSTGIEVDEGGEFDEEALRKYQLDRLRYFYAIATFDSPQTARYIIDEIDGSEMEHSANMFDLSFVPADMTFPDWQAPSDEPGNEGWRDQATETTINDAATYKGVDFMTDALRHSKVKLTWDADDPQRAKVTRQAGMTADDIRDNDFKAYLASASEESESDSEDEGHEREEDEGQGRDRMRALLGLNGHDGSVGYGKAKSAAFADARKARESKRNQGEMEITFLPGLSEAAERRKKGLGPSTTKAEEETTLDKYKRKQREKRELRRLGADSRPDEAVAGVSNGGSDENDAEAAYDFNDPFFADNDQGEIDFDAELAAEKKDKGSKAKAKATRVGNEEAKDEGNDVADRKTLELLVDSNDDPGESGGAGHFSLKDILKAEETGKKKGRWAKKKEKKLAAKGLTRGENEVQPGFEIDVNDARFQNLYGDHRFALDPSHPNFLKTKNTQRFIDERRKKGRLGQQQSSLSNKDASGKIAVAEDDDLSLLVKSVKKRSANEAPPSSRTSQGKKSKQSR